MLKALSGVYIEEALTVPAFTVTKNSIRVEKLPAGRRNEWWTLELSHVASERW